METYRRQYELKFMKNEVYEAPQVEIIEVEVEKGFATSNPYASGEGGSESIL